MLSDDRGYSLVELLVAMLIGVVVLFGIFALVDTATRTTAKTTDRLDTLARTRAAAEQVRSRLRAAVCPDDGTRPLLTANDASVSFVARVADRPAGAAYQSPPMQRRTITLSGGLLTEQVFDQVAGAGNNAVFNATPSRTQLLLENAGTPSGQPLFTYQDATGTPIVDPAQRTNAARVRVQLVGAARRPEPGLGTTSDSTVVLRLDDPTDQDTSPEC